MKQKNYKPLGEFIQPVEGRKTVLGLSEKLFNTTN